jgi:predicted DNA-binding protein
MKKKAKPTRHNNRMMISLPPDERLRLANFAKELGRPVSWVVRDAVRAYAVRVRPVLEQFRESLAHGDTLNEERAPTTKRGRPPKPRRSASKSHKKP